MRTEECSVTVSNNVWMAKSNVTQIDNGSLHLDLIIFFQLANKKKINEDLHLTAPSEQVDECQEQTTEALQSKHILAV